MLVCKWDIKSLDKRAQALTDTRSDSLFVAPFALDITLHYIKNSDHTLRCSEGWCTVTFKTCEVSTVIDNIAPGLETGVYRTVTPHGAWYPSLETW